MADDRIDAYAAALFEVAKAEGSLATVEEELFRIARTVEGSDELRSTLTDQAVPVERRQGVVEDLFGGKASPVTTALVSFVVGSGRSKDLPAIIDRLVERAAQERNEAVAEVRSAVPLDEGQQQRLAAALGKATGKNISVKVIVDPSILGGIVAQVGDTVIDGSVRTRLNQLREAL
ncbi:MAG TPA: ATP synthase F1 subunit delta [Acidimicrobiales bacterium]|nr:ATP synthase F1 subunit delta [Acidimicrobiales bacterium]